MYTCICVCMNMYIYARIRLYEYIDMYARMYTCICMILRSIALGCTCVDY